MHWDSVGLMQTLVLLRRIMAGIVLSGTLHDLLHADRLQSASMQANRAVALCDKYFVLSELRKTLHYFTHYL